MNTESGILLLLVGATFSVAYERSYHVLWFKLQSLFDLSLSSTQCSFQPLALLRTRKDGFLYKFYNEHSLSSRKVVLFIRVLFSTTSALCVTAIEVILWQIKTADNNIDQNGNITIKLIWSIISIGLSINLIFLQPFLILLSLLSKFFDDRLHSDYIILITSAAIIFWISSLNFINWGPFYYSSNLLTKLSIVGVSVMALLSAVASVSTPYYVFLYFWNRRHFMTANFNSNIPLLLVNDAIVEEKYRDCRTNFEENFKILENLEREPGGTNSVMREQLVEKIGRHQIELAKLEKRINDSRKSRYLKRVFHLGFLIYCLYKLMTTFFYRIPVIIKHLLKYPDDYNYEFFDSLLDGENGSQDPLAVTLANILDFMLFHFNYQQELDSLTKQISLILSISLFICSFSTVKTTISYLLTLCPLKLQILAFSAIKDDESRSSLPFTRVESFKGNKQPSIIKNLIISELTGIYVLATILMIRSNLPFEVSEKLNQLLGERFTVPNVVIDIWFDEVFALCSILAFCGIKIAESLVVDNSSVELEL
ncbi:LAFE_0D07140g1_1 [Lachancea fermentati]|uniref:LAFE_0D07140g1_1 n=1 Tax=Lachancea fermentati TaxID=4955 RepID=A0A1G4MBM2_LACFM|nr:LAFE_0D07140g1_1 [Lachancea fermentati]